MEERLHKMVNGEKVFLTPEEEIAKRAEWADRDAKKAEFKLLHGHEAVREAAYPPIGDQLDAIWKQMIADRDTGKVLHVESDLIADKILEVKALYPKAT